MFFKIVGGDNYELLAPIIEELVAEDGYILHSIHCGEISVTSPLTAYEWWSKARIMFCLGAQVIAVLKSPKPSVFSLQYIS